MEIPEPEFRKRFVVGRVFLLASAFLAILTLFWIVNPARFWIALPVHILVLAFAAWLAAKASHTHLAIAREMGSDMARFGPADSVRSHVLPLLGAALIVGSIRGFSRHDWRWLLIAGGLAGLLAAGLLVRWVVYDRWLVALSR